MTETPGALAALAAEALTRVPQPPQSEIMDEMGRDADARRRLAVSGACGECSGTVLFGTMRETRRHAVETHHVIVDGTMRR